MRQLYYYRQIRQTDINETFTLWSKEPFRQQYTAPAARQDSWYFFLNLLVQCFITFITICHAYELLHVFMRKVKYRSSEQMSAEKFQTFPRLLKTPSNVDQTKSVCAGLRRGLFEWPTPTWKSCKFHIRLPTHKT